ncbi:MAG: ABC transporter permease [Planctomycetota bacterium]|nr:ABC transporter permease [Planctomycetota bacterium]
MIGLVLRNLRFFWRSHLWVVMGAATSAAVLVGALLVGDSVRMSLRDHALSRIGSVDTVLQVHERFFQSDLADRFVKDSGLATVAPVLALSGIAKDPDGDGRAGIVEVLGVDQRFFALGPRQQSRAPPGPGRAYINQRLAHQLGVARGRTILIRVEKPGLLPREMAMSTVEDASFALRVEVEDILVDSEFGRFGLRASQVPPFNLFMSLPWLQTQLELEGKANLLLGGGALPSSELTASANAELRGRWSLQDLEVRRRAVPDVGLTEILSDRVFLDPAVVDAAMGSGGEYLGVLTYFVDGLRHKDRMTPYSMVAAVGPLTVPGLSRPTPPKVAAAYRSLLPGDVPATGIVLNAWCAEDLQAKVGDPVALDYQVLGPDLKLHKRSREFQVSAILPLEGAVADQSLMPAFPGLHDSENCRDWETGFPIDLDKIRDKDEEYWDEYRGVPKAFVTLAAGQAMWQNRYGALTSLRIDTSELPASRVLASKVEPAEAGFFFRDVRAEALAAGTSATDFGGLFLGLSFFLILAALLLTGLLFVFGVERRACEIGSLLAMGFRPRVVRNMFLVEALVLSTLGSVLGAGLGFAYTAGLLRGLDTLWQGAVGSTSLTFHVLPMTLGLGVGIAIFVSLGAIAFSMRRTFGTPAVDLLASQNGIPRSDTSSRVGRASSVLMFAAPPAAVGLAVFAGTSPEQVVGAFFGAGALLLIGMLAGCRRWLSRLANAGAAGHTAGLSSLRRLASRNAGRRPGRSLLTIAMLASGTFLVVAVQSNQLAPPRDATRRDSGTGGFAWFGRTSLPVLRDLGSTAGLEAFGLSAEDLEGASIVPMRVHEGDDASCLNLSQARLPSLLGVAPQALATRGAFAFAGQLEATEGSPWDLLSKDYGPGVVPAVGDAASVTWALHKGLGDGLSYRDERGQEFEVRIVGTVADSILQGYLLISDQHLRDRFPSVSGYEMFLVDAPPRRAVAIAEILTRALEDIGLELTSTADRLASFQAVQNTYLLIFQVLGGLGLLLGSVGVGVVVLRNALERRSELALLSAVGYSRRNVRRLVFSEHGQLLGLGIGVGVIAALLAVLPGTGTIAVWPMLGLIGLVALSGAVWVMLATAYATRGELRGALHED